MSFRNLKVGDRVDRYIGIGFFMEMHVIEVRDTVLVCGPVHVNGKLLNFGPEGNYKFDLDLGCEEDEDLGWGRAFGKTGSYLKLKEKDNG